MSEPLWAAVPLPLLLAVLEDGAPVQHLESSFGASKPPGREDLTSVRGSYDAWIAAVLETEFAS
ncbi:hypothetical protein [Streptomyces sp. NPDC054786]